MQPKMLLALAASAAALCGQTTDPERIMAALKNRALADNAMRMKTDERVALYNALVQYKPGDPHYQNLLAAAYIQKARETTDFSYVDRAGRLLASVLDTDGDNYEALRLRSEIELERHNFSKVAEYSRRLTQRAPDDPWNWGTLGDALMELGKYDGAAEAYQRMVSLRPDLASYNRAAYYRFVAGDAPGAIALMQRAILAGSPSAENTAWCLVELGDLYVKTGQLAEAEHSFTAALRTFPGYHPALAGQGHVAARNGNARAAIESYRRAQAATPLPDYAAALHDLYLAVGQTDEAQKQLALLDVIDKMARASNEKTNRALALIYADRGRNLDRALELAHAELEIRKDVYTWDTLAWALFKNNKYAEAEAAITEALKMGTPEAQFHYHAGMIAAALGKKGEAAKQLERALALNPKFDARQAAIAETTLRGLLL